MKLYEYEAKQILQKYGLPIPKGVIISSHKEVVSAWEKLGGNVVLKAQVLVGGRGKAGAIKFPESIEEAKQLAQKLFSMKVKGLPVARILVEEKVRIKRELYLGMTFDRSLKRFVIICSPMGGIEIEEIAMSHPEAIKVIPIDPFIGVRPYHAMEVCKHLKLKKENYKELSAILFNMYKAAMDHDAELIEFNPLVLTEDGKVMCVDARLNIDDNATFRHMELVSEERMKYELSDEEIEARKYGLSYVKLDGDIGILGNGAGLVMATMDMVNLYGGKVANFLDIGGGASKEQIEKGLSILIKDPRLKVLLVNVLGGITRCDEVAKAIVSTIEKFKIKIPMVVRLVGTNEELGREILEEKGIHVLSDMEEAVKKAVELAKVS